MIAWGETDPPPGSLAQRLLERVLARNPDHSGAIHYYIHLTDWIDRQELAVPYAERLGRIAPAASHLVHMPSHTFYGVGRYRDAAAVNVAAIAADRAFVQRVRPAASDYRCRPARPQHALRDRKRAGAGRRRHRARRVAPVSRDLSAGERRRRARGCWARRPVTRAACTTTVADGARAARARPMRSTRRMRHYARGEALARRGDAAGGARRGGGDRGAARGPAMRRRSGGAAARSPRSSSVCWRAGRRCWPAIRARPQPPIARRWSAQLAADFGSDPPLFWYSVRRSLAAAMLAAGDARSARAQLYASLRHWPNDPLALYAAVAGRPRRRRRGRGRPQPRPGPRDLGRAT